MSRTPPETLTAPARSLRILFVEDSPADVELCLHELRKAGFEVTADVVETPEEFEERLRSNLYDLVLADYNLPHWTGIEALEHMRQQGKDIPLILVTGALGDETAVECIKRGATDYVTKDRLARLPVAVRRALEEKALRDERTRAEEELKAAQLQLIQSAKLESVGRLAAGVAHEVKNPLGVILQGLAYLSHAGLATDDDALAPVLKKMDNAVRRADRVIRDLLGFSAPSQVDLKPTDLNVVVEQSLLLVKHELDKAQVTIVKQLGDNLPPLMLDRHKMEQVFVNLFMNAIHAMPDGGTLTVKTDGKQPTDLAPSVGRRPTGSRGAGQPLVVVEVEDTGIGIPAEKLSRIFDPFFTTKPAGEGTGLGLSVTRQIVELHGATIDIRNRQEGGVRATIMFKTQGGHEDGEEADPGR
jgi:signal transduction histidine kinase